MRQRNLRIAHILPSLAHSGPTLVAKDIITHLPVDVEVDVFYLDDIKEVSMPCPIYKTNIYGQGIEWQKYDIVHSHMLRPDLLVRLNRRKIRGKCISTLHNYVQDDLAYQYNNLISTLITPLWRRLLNKHDVLVALSAHMKKYYDKLYNHSDIIFIYNGRDISFSTTEQGRISDADKKLIEKFKVNSILIGVAALLTDRKGIDQLISLLAMAPEYKLLIIGNGQSEAKLKELATRKGVIDRCLFLGYRKMAHRYYKYFDLYAMPSRSEGFPLALLEAAAYSLPVIGSDLPVFREIFNSNEIMFFELDNILDLKEKAQSLYINRESFAENLHIKYKQKYTAQHMAMQYYELYTKLATYEA